MPRDKDFKRHVRHRMSKTGERYTTARDAVRPSGLQLEGWELRGRGAYEWAFEGDGTLFLQRVDGEEKGAFGSLSARVPAAALVGRRLLLHGLVRAEGVEVHAGLFMAMLDAEQGFLSLDDLQDRPLRGTFDWRPVEVVLDVPAESATIFAGPVLRGAGRLWVRDLRLEIAKGEVPTTRDPLPDGWGLITGRESYRLTTEPAEKPYSRVTLLRSVTKPGPTGGNIVRPVLAERYRGHRVRLRAALRGESVERSAGLWMNVGVPGGRALRDNMMEDRPFRGTFDWSIAEIVLDVAEAAETIACGANLQGSGALWIADPELEIVEGSVPPTRPALGWTLEADRSDAYALSRSVTEQATGAWSDVWVLRSAGDPGAGSGVLSRRVPARFFDGGSARLRARVSGYALSLPAELWIRVECAARFVLGTAPSPSGTFDWTVTTAVAEVPHDATAIAYGLRLPGAGTLRVTDVSLDRGAP